jgi:hypothetical protein
MRNIAMNVSGLEMKQLRYIFLLWMNFAMSISLVYGQLEKVEAYYKELEQKAENEPVTLRFVQAGSYLVDDFDALSQIILIRHGEPALDRTGWRKRQEAIEFIRAYDTVGI